jgi:hypothetical protein
MRSCKAGRVIDRARRVRRLLGALTAGVLIGAAAACTSVLDRPSLPSAGPAAGRSGLAQPTTAASITPITPDELLAGPGVTDRSISLGVLADPARDHGFTEGVRLWQRSGNTTGGLCGRTVEIRTNGADGIPTDPATAYRRIGTSVLGLLTLPVGPTAGSSGSGDPAVLAASITADQIPALTPTGTSTQLGPTRPVVVGATADILAINGLHFLLRTGTLKPGDVVGVLSDGSAGAEDAVRGARWWAQENGLTLDVRDTGTIPAPWPGAAVVLAPVGSATVAALLTGNPQVSVLTLVDGFDPGTWPTEVVGAAAGRLYVASPTPAFGSDYPAAVAVSSTAAAVGSAEPGTRTLDGYATGATWGRLLGQACADRSLTRPGVWTAAAGVGPAASSSLFGASDPGVVVQSALPATRESSVSVADAAAITGLRSLTGLESAPGLEDYQP